MSLEKVPMRRTRSTRSTIFVETFCAYLVSCTTDEPKRIVRNSGEGYSLEAWRRLQSECNPTSSMRRVAMQVQNPPRCQRVEDWRIGSQRNGNTTCSLTVTTLPGIRRQPCGDHVQVGAKEPGRDRHVHQ